MQIPAHGFGALWNRPLYLAKSTIARCHQAVITVALGFQKLPGWRERLPGLPLPLDCCLPLKLAATAINGNVNLTWPANIVCHLQAQTNSLVSGNWSDLPITNPVVVVPNPTNSSVFYRLKSP